MTIIWTLFQLPRMFTIARFKHACNYWILKSNIAHSRYYSDQLSSTRIRTSAMSAGNKIFQGKLDRFQGITVDSNREQCPTEDFPNQLEESLSFWKNNGNRGIWFNVHLNQASWVPILAKKGFKYHHALDEYVMMYLWLPQTENCNIPQYAHTMIGVGAVVINDKNKLLVVKEKYSIVGSNWKLPGGYVEPGENLVDAAIREVHEETGISTEFQSVLSIRHAHGGMFNCSDIYTVVSLKPLSEDIEKCEREIEDCKWMDIDEYLNHDQAHELNKFQVQKYLEYKNRNIKVNCYHGIHKLLQKPYTLYSVTNDDEDKVKNNKL